MDKKSKILIGIFICMVFISVAITFYRYIVLNDIIFYTTDEETFKQSLLENE